MNFFSPQGPPGAQGSTGLPGPTGPPGAVVSVPINHSFSSGEKKNSFHVFSFIVCVSHCAPSFHGIYFCPAGSTGPPRTARAGGEYAVLIWLLLLLHCTLSRYKMEEMFWARGFWVITRNGKLIRKKYENLFIELLLINSDSAAFCAHNLKMQVKEHVICCTFSWKTSNLLSMYTILTFVLTVNTTTNLSTTIIFCFAPNCWLFV